MSAFNNKFNFQDSNIRNIIIAICSEFTNKMDYKQYTDSNEYEIIKIPFYNSFTGSEDFLKDQFISDELVNSQQQIDGLYNVIPRGILIFNSLEIDSGSLVNRFVRTEIPKKVDETTYKMYSYETLILPINLTFDVKILCSSWIEMLKILEFGLLKNFYKSTPFYVDYGGYRARGYINIPENEDLEKLTEFSYSDKKTYDISFSIDVNTYLPIFNEGSEIFLGNKMTGFDVGLYDISLVPTNTIQSHTNNSSKDNTGKKFN